MKSLLILIRYHLGTIVFGAIVLCLFETFKNIIDRCRQISEGGLCRKLFLLIITVPASFCNLFWELISSNSIYVTVIYGVGYCRGLRRAKVLINFAESLYVHMISDMVRVICVFIVFTASIFVACLTLEDAEFFDYWQVYITFLLIAFLIPVLFLSIYKVKKLVSVFEVSIKKFMISEHHPGDFHVSVHRPGGDPRQMGEVGVFDHQFKRIHKGDQAK